MWPPVWEIAVHLAVAGDVFMLSCFPLDVLDEILDLIETVSEGFPTYFLNLLPLYLAWRNARLNLSTLPQNGELKPSILKVYGYTCICFPPRFQRETIFCYFLFAYLEDEDFPKWGLLLKVRICSDQSKLFPL